jgi:hypothetical protein
VNIRIQNANRTKQGICAVTCILVLKQHHRHAYITQKWADVMGNQIPRLKTYFGCRIADQKLVSGTSCDRPPRRRFFFVSLCLKANTEVVPKTPSCYCMLLMWPSRLKFLRFMYMYYNYCHQATAHLQLNILLLYYFYYRGNVQ